MLFNDRIAKDTLMKMIKQNENDVKQSKPFFVDNAGVLRRYLSAEFKKIDFKSWGYSKEDVGNLLDIFSGEIPQEVFNVYQDVVLSNNRLIKNFSWAASLVFLQGSGVVSKQISTAVKYAKDHKKASLTQDEIYRLSSEVPYDEHKEYVDIATTGLVGTVKDKIKKGLKSMKNDFDVEIPGLGTQMFGAVERAAGAYIDVMISAMNESFLKGVYGEKPAADSP